MKRMITSIALVGFAASLLLAVAASRGGWPGIVPNVCAEENEGWESIT